MLCWQAALVGLSQAQRYVLGQRRARLERNRCPDGGAAPNRSHVSKGAECSPLLQHVGRTPFSPPLCHVQSNKDAARTIYEQCGAKEKLTMIYAEEGNVDQLVAAAGGKPGEQPNYTYLLQARCCDARYVRLLSCQTFLS